MRRSTSTACRTSPYSCPIFSSFLSVINAEGTSGPFAGRNARSWTSEFRQPPSVYIPTPPHRPLASCRWCGVVRSWPGFGARICHVAQPPQPLSRSRLGIRLGRPTRAARTKARRLRVGVKFSILGCSLLGIATQPWSPTSSLQHRARSPGRPSLEAFEWSTSKTTLTLCVVGADIMRALRRLGGGGFVVITLIGALNELECNGIDPKKHSDRQGKE